ncbi:hypothetical protein GH733_002259 [Mirounga leonina]|nr:hypothetical protein GH733_002259 [Mirounga leonina]
MVLAESMKGKTTGAQGSHGPHGSSTAPLPATICLEMRLPKAQAMAAPTRPPPDTTTSYTVSALAPDHLRQESSGPLPGAAGAALHRLTASRAAMVLTCNVLGAPLGPPFAALPEQSSPITSCFRPGLRAGNRTRKE